MGTIIHYSILYGKWHATAVELADKLSIGADRASRSPTHARVTWRLCAFEVIREIQIPNADDLLNARIQPILFGQAPLNGSLVRLPFGDPERQNGSCEVLPFSF
jgi:hypothetical protein